MTFKEIPKIVYDKFNEEFTKNKKLMQYLENNKFTFEKLLSYGKTSWIIIVKKDNIEYAIKTLKKDSTRKNAIEKEAYYLNIVNKENIGQKLIEYNRDINFVMWEYIHAKTFSKWIKNQTRENILKVIKSCLKDAKKLDKINIDHSQLAGAGTNILVKENLETIIVDFEKSSENRKTHNYNILLNYFLRHKDLKKFNLTINEINEF